MAKNFLFSGNIRVGPEPATHRSGSRTFTWYKHSSDLWKHVNWNQANSFIQSHCQGSTQGAAIIEKTINILDKYVGENGKQSLQPEDAQYLSDGLYSELIQSLNNISLGRSGTALSLLNYQIGTEKWATAENAGFSFETRLSEFIQRLFQITDFSSDKMRKALRSGGQMAEVGGSELYYLGHYEGKANDISKNQFLKSVVDDIKDFGANLRTYAYKEITKKLDNGKYQTDVFLTTYKVPQKADITIPNYMSIHSRYGSLVESFLKEVQGRKFSLKNTSKGEEIKLGSTKDSTRLRGFLSEFAKGIDISFGNIATFVYSSKASGNEEVHKYLDWARIVYELLGTGQHFQPGDNLLVDYLIINNYVSGQGGHASVFNVKDLIANIPGANYDPPFKISGANHEGPVTLNFKSLNNFVFS